MRRLFLAFTVLVAPLLMGWGTREGALQWPQSGPMPHDPVKVKPYTYTPVTEGNQSYRPIDPLPWGAVNNRVAPPRTLPGSPPPKMQDAPQPAAPKGGAAKP